MDLKGKTGLVIGVANEQSIAWGCAKAYASLGADLTLTYQTKKRWRMFSRWPSKLGLG